MLFVHELDVTFAPRNDQRALGGAVTQALCGHWDHEGACRWPHRTETEPTGPDAVAARVLFVCEPAEEGQVRAKIVEAARSGMLEGPDGPSHWTLDRESLSAPRSEDAV